MADVLHDPVWINVRHYEVPALITAAYFSFAFTSVAGVLDTETSRRAFAVALTSRAFAQNVSASVAPSEQAVE